MQTYRSILGQARGLMFSRKRNIMFVFDKERYVSLHTFFVFFPIDVILLNEKKQVVETKQNFKPFRFWKSKEKAKYVIEIADKEIKEDLMNINKKTN